MADKLAEEAAAKHQKEVDALAKRAAQPSNEEMEARRQAKWTVLVAEKAHNSLTLRSNLRISDHRYPAASKFSGTILAPSFLAALRPPFIIILQ